jgi:hypothetical protein
MPVRLPGVDGRTSAGHDVLKVEFNAVWYSDPGAVHF